MSKSSFEDVFFQPDDEDPNEFGLIRQSESLKNSRSIAVDPNKRQTVLQDEDFVDDSDGEAAADDSPIFGFGGADEMLADTPMSPRKMQEQPGFSGMANNFGQKDSQTKRIIRYGRSQSSNDVPDAAYHPKRDNERGFGQDELNPEEFEVDLTTDPRMCLGTWATLKKMTSKTKLTTRRLQIQKDPRPVVRGYQKDSR